MKKAILIVMVLALGLTVCACSSPKEEDIIGSWASKSVYLASMDAYVTTYIYFSEGGSYFWTFIDSKTGSILEYTYGGWSIVGNTVVMDDDVASSTVKYVYSSGKLQSGSDVLEKSSDAQKFYEEIFKAAS